jgi:flagellin
MSGLIINDNITALNATNNLNATSNMLSQAVGKLSSGLNIQTAADDPSGYVQAQYLQEQSNGYGAAISNAQDAVSVLQTAQGALNQESTVLQTMNTLATSAANGGTLDASSSAAAQSEFASLQNELDQIAGSTTYGTTPLLGGTYTGQTFQVGPYATANDQVIISISASDSTTLGVNTSAVSIGTASAAAAAMTAVQAAIKTVATTAASVGASQNQIQALASNLTTAQQNIQAAHANLVDVNIAQESATFTSDQILQQSGVAILAQSEQLPALALKLLP